MTDGNGGPALPAGDDSQHQSDSGVSQARAASSGPAGRDSIAAAGNYVPNANAGRDVIGGDKNSRVAVNLGAFAVIIGIIIGLYFGGRFLINKATDTLQQASVSETTSCADYLQRSDADRQAAIRSVGLKLGVKGIGSPLMLPEVDYECGNAPQLAFGAVMKRQQGY